MRKLLLFYTIIFSFSLSSCQKSDNKLNDHITQKINNQNLVGKIFYKVENEKGNIYIYQQCGFNIPEYRVYKDSIFHNYGQEFYTFKIKSFNNTSKKIFFHGQYEYKNTIVEKTDIIFQLLDEKQGLWKINNEYFIDEAKKSNIPIKKEICDDDGDTNNYMSSDQNLYLYGNLFLKDINIKNILTQKAINIIESTISYYTLQKDYSTKSFYDRESTKIKIKLNENQMKIWKLCNQYLDFSKVCSNESLESDWRFPYSKIQTLESVYKLYANRSYGDSYQAETIKYHMALYMYFLSWNERRKVYEEIDSLKEKLKKENTN